MLLSFVQRVKISDSITGSESDKMSKKNYTSRLKFVSFLLLISLAYNSSACTLRPPLQNEEWIYLSNEERRSVFESILQEPDNPSEHLKYLYISIGGIIAFVGLGAAFEGKKGSGIYPWLAFGSSFGIVWTGMSALIQKNYTHQIKRIAKAEVEVEKIKTIAKIEISEIEQRGLTRFVKEEGKRQENIERMTFQAA